MNKQNALGFLLLNKRLGSSWNKMHCGIKGGGFSFRRSVSIFLWWIKTWAKLVTLKRKHVQGSKCTLSLDESNHQMIKKLTQHLRHLLWPKQASTRRHGYKLKWLWFDRKENKIFCEFCREFQNKKNMQYSLRIGMNNFQTDNLKAREASEGHTVWH